MTNKTYPSNITEVQDVLTANGWHLVDDDTVDCILYEKDLSVGTRVITCQTWSGGHDDGLDATGTCSIQSIEVSCAECSPYDVEELMDMICAIGAAEDELVKLGIPFTARYQFHGEDRDDQAFYNEKNRSKIKDLVD